MDTQRVLYVNGGIMHRGGIESYMMNYYRNIDRTKIQIDFVVHGFEKGAYDDEIEELGGEIYRVPVKSKDYFGNVKALKNIFNTGKYKVIHSHMDAMSYVVLKIAKECGVPIRIAHSHNTQHLTKNKIKLFFNEYARKHITEYATHCFACSELAGRWLFGDSMVEDNKVIYIKNAINVDKYLFNEQIRQKIRKELNLENSFVIGHIGRFDYQKNHFFLLDIFKAVLKKKSNAKLVLVGDGHLSGKIEEKIAELNLSDRVILLGIRNDVETLLNSFDVFCLPSYFEGLSVVLIEAQANGLSCVVSNTNSKEADITGRIDFVSLSKDTYVWANKIANAKRDIFRNGREKIIEASYSIIEESKKLENIYVEMLNIVGRKR